MSLKMTKTVISLLMSSVSVGYDRKYTREADGTNYKVCKLLKVHFLAKRVFKGLILISA